MTHFLGPILILALTALLAAQPQANRPAAPVRAVRDDAAAEKLGWRLGAQAWTFRDRSTFEAIDAVHALGLRYIELYPGQALTKESKTIKTGAELTGEQVASLRQKLKESGVAAVNFGVVVFKNDEGAARKSFEFAKALGIETITCEPEDGAWDLVERLAEEYKVNLAVHNHPKPSRYWNPDAVLAAIKGRSGRCGACADTGHWARSGLAPLECLRKLEGHVITLHFKDIKDDKDQPWGTGTCDARGMLMELQRQHFRGVISMEYESGAGKELGANAAKCVEFFDGVARDLVKGEK